MHFRLACNPESCKTDGNVDLKDNFILIFRRASELPGLFFHFLHKLIDEYMKILYKDIRSTLIR